MSLGQATAMTQLDPDGPALDCFSAQAIRVIKFYAWERPMRRKIEESRRSELEQLWNLLLLKSFNLAVTIVWFVLNVFRVEAVVVCFERYPAPHSWNATTIRIRVQRHSQAHPGDDVDLLRQRLDRGRMEVLRERGRDDVGFHFAASTAPNWDAHGAGRVC